MSELQIYAPRPDGDTRKAGCLDLDLFFGSVLVLLYNLSPQKKTLVVSLLKVSATKIESDFGSDWVRLKLFCAFVQVL